MTASVPEGMTRLVLVRHGEASGNREMRYLGSTDAPLTANGHAQADQVARAVVQFAPVVVYASPLTRAVATATAIGLFVSAEVRIEANLRESAFGAWEGLTRAEALARDAGLVRRWESDADVAPPDGGESLSETQRRVAVCADLLAARHPGTTLALVSHVGPVKALVCCALGLGADAARRMWLDPASISVVDWPADSTRTASLRIYNSVAHLEDGVRWLPRR